MFAPNTYFYGQFQEKKARCQGQEARAETGEKACGQEACCKKARSEGEDAREKS
ncbi:MAG: hypothetical protein M3Y03_06275 [Verrucomicrobiota bacterium]|nr:hypothetical protein [Verrucomicrobiota bacterium]